MTSLFLKELRQFFSGPMAYLILAVFYTANGLMLFVLPGALNIWDAGYATLDAFFSWTPWMFLFLVPALCMKTFAEEKKTGTMEMLLTRPLSSFRIFLAKYGACLVLLLLALLPTFCYLATVSALAKPAGNVDYAAFWGAFLGLLLLGAAFTSVCVFMSSLTDNQVVAFVSGAACCALLYTGFELFSALNLKGGFALALSKLGIKYHYASLSRGVIDARDVVYYLFVIVVFGILTDMRIGARTARKQAFYTGVLGVTTLVLLVTANLPFRLRADLTSDRRYTLMPVSGQILRETDKPVLVNVYLTGDLPAGFKRLEKSVRETLDEFRIYAPSLRYRFVDLYAMEDEKARREQMRELAEMGVNPVQLEVKTKQGMTRRLIFPVAELRAGGQSIVVKLLADQLGRGAEETLNNSVENIEVQLVNGIRRLFEPCRAAVAFSEGNGEAGFYETVSLGSALTAYYDVGRTPVTASPKSLLRYDSAEAAWVPLYKTLLVVRPAVAFTESQKFVLDQYIMHGGRVLWLLDAGTGSLDSLRDAALYDALPYDLNLEDMFFRYGFRLRPEMLLDKNAALSPIVTGFMGQQPMIEFIPNYYCPVVEMKPEELSPAQQCLSCGVGPVRLQVSAGLDTIENDIRKTVLLRTSDYSYRIRLPHAMSADLMRSDLDLRRFKEPSQAVALLLEGGFQTAYPLVKPALEDAEGFTPRKTCEKGAMIAAGDGDLAVNDWEPRAQQPLPLGMDRYTGQMYSNGDFLLNAVHYLCGHPEYALLKPRAVQLRLLDKASLVKHRALYTFLNFALPLGCVPVFGLLFVWLRKRRYTR